MTVYERIQQSERDHHAHTTRSLKAAFKRGTGVYHIKSCPNPKGVTWMYILDQMPNHGDGSDGGGGGIIIGGIGTDGRLYSKEAYYRECFREATRLDPKVNYTLLPCLWLSE